MWIVKECAKCKEIKLLSEFHKSKKGSLGYRSSCRFCYEKYYETNKEKIKVRNRKHYKANKEKINESNKKYYEANKDKIKERMKTNKYKINARRRERLKNEPLFKLQYNLRIRTSQAFKSKGYKKNSQTMEILGVEWEVVKTHIERQFTKGMNWDNQGEWHIDHIIPLASATDEKTLRKLCHYTNLQPLWAEDNLSKNDKIIDGTQVKLRI
jgi:hypothetical protein